MLSGIYFKKFQQIKGVGWDRRNMIGKIWTIAETGKWGLIIAVSLPLCIFEKYNAKLFDFSSWLILKEYVVDTIRIKGWETADLFSSLHGLSEGLFWGWLGRWQCLIASFLAPRTPGSPVWSQEHIKTDLKWPRELSRSRLPGELPWPPNQT